MTPLPRAGNVHRARWRKRCRQKLADHIKVKLGIEIEPDQVRLLTDSNDAYDWKWLPEQQHLFTRQLSKHSTGAYMEICREIGRSVEAVPREDSGNGISPFVGGFTDKISLLEKSNHRLETELADHRNAAAQQVDANRELVETVELMQADLERARENAVKLTEHKYQLEKRIRILSNRMSRSKKGLRMALVALHRLKD